jgi:hypothetical protein
MRRASCQARETLDQFYAKMDTPEQDEFTRGRGRAMRELLPLLDQAFGTTPVWGLTSLQRLVLLSEDNFAARWHVMIWGCSGSGYSIEYWMPDVEAPWPDATVRGYPETKEQAVAWVKIACHRSGGWATGV